jgi:hypothetical protein
MEKPNTNPQATNLDEKGYQPVELTENDKPQSYEEIQSSGFAEKIKSFIEGL